MSNARRNQSDFRIESAHKTARKRREDDFVHGRRLGLAEISGPSPEGRIRASFRFHPAAPFLLFARK